jgi:radical SAM superfamily enzyme YgiQ (UPF0313 family)
MRVLLINPDVRNRSVIYGVRMLNPLPVSLAYRAAQMCAHHDVEIVDENTGIPDYENLFEDVGLVGITSKFFGESRTMELVRRFQKMGKPVVVDGYFPTFASDRTQRNGAATIVGEVEEVWPQIVADCERNTLQPLYHSGPVDLKSLPLYKAELLPRHDFVFPVEATRGCPFYCSFCVETRFHAERFRKRPVADVVRQIELGGHDRIHFSDINIVGDLSHARNLFTALRPLNVLWGSQATITLAQNPSLVELAASSGCMIAFIGLESTSDASVRAGDKGWSKTMDYPALIRRLHDHGIAVMASFVFGFDTDTDDAFKRTLEFVLENQIEICHFNPLNAVPGTPVREELELSGRILDNNPDNADHFHMQAEPRLIRRSRVATGVADLYRAAYSRAGTQQRLQRYRDTSVPIPGPRAEDKRRAILTLNAAYRVAVEKAFSNEASTRRASVGI